ncbi:hypothetical protein RUM44_006495 [Polyplax serrata]|uniref:Ig-like domain-containing protein n=1 Tax=Polyplax serrata TaxID=468196 RepID=A0ABR1AJ00_POLSC
MQNIQLSLGKSGGSVPPRYHERVSPAPVREGETAVLTCTSQGYPPPQYTWFKVHPTNGHLEPVATTEKKHIREGVLIMQNAGLSDSGRYVCVANNSLGSERVELQLTVLVPISVHLTPQRVTVDLSQDTTLTCSVTGHPSPTITWRKDGLPIRNVSHRVRITGENSSRLEVSRMVREDKGMYQCFAKNDYEMSQGTAELRLGEELKLLSNQTNIHSDTS